MSSRSTPEKPQLNWISEPKKPSEEDPNANMNPLYYRDDMSFLRETTQPDSAGESLKQLFRDKPLVSIGCLATTGFLLAGLKSFYQENQGKSQLMMRGRVLAQGFTVAALVGGALLETSKRLQNAKPPAS
ncbi:HIG1 domain family member 2A [Caligus rogercresseyi]|uniref:HIG1 domain family member 2A n=1 Tax=Caligus rogercresseyi TaxID=217165 RepID=A0A7T8KI76_CALRO|nr:HIG1 domain family member 2A [Caligus rogercresseyi]